MSIYGFRGYKLAKARSGLRYIRENKQKKADHEKRNVSINLNLFSSTSRPNIWQF